MSESVVNKLTWILTCLRRSQMMDFTILYKILLYICGFQIYCSVSCIRNKPYVISTVRESNIKYFFHMWLYNFVKAG